MGYYDTMRNTVEALAQGYQMYKVRRPEYQTDDPIPFRTSPSPLQLTPEQSQEIRRIGPDICNYVEAVSELYRTDGSLREILNRGKPEIFLTDRIPAYLFYRPDLVITPDGFIVCEIETSLFGLAIAHLLNKASISEGYSTMVGEEELPNHIIQNTPTDGTVIYSQRTNSYSGQLAFLAHHIFSGNKHGGWQAALVDQTSGRGKPVYRGFYLAEYLDDPLIQLLLDRIDSVKTPVLPSLTPFLEEKATLALLWDKRWEEILRRRLGDASFKHLRQVIPPTWIVGEEKYFSPGLPDGVSITTDLAGLSRSKRTLVLKTSGFNNNASWGEGVVFLHQESRDTVRRLLTNAASNQDNLSIIQDFQRGVKMPIEYETTGGEVRTMMAKVRLTPYFSPDGRLIAIKATSCENTDYIHASTASANTAVAGESLRFY